MQQSAFIARCPYEIGDKIKITLYNHVGVIGGPVTMKTIDAIITDIYSVYSLKMKKVTFMYEINNTKVLQLVEWEAVKYGKQGSCDRFGH